MARPETLLAHAGCEPDPATGAVVSPPYLTTTYERAADGSYPHGFQYARTGNPTRAQLEETLSAFEGGTGCAAFSSGMAAAMTVLQALPPGTHILLPDDVYYGVRQLISEAFEGRGLTSTAVDMTDLDALDAAVRPTTRLIWAETPSNPMLRITDLGAVADLAHDHDALLLVDGTWTTPLLQRPLELGADFVLHSVTKYLAGHSDVLGGAVIAAEESAVFNRIRSIQETGGPVLDPFSAWLALRGLRSLAPRLRLQCASARTIASFLDGHERVAAVHHPSLPHHPGHAVANRQMDDFGGMLSFEVDGDRETAMGMAARVRVFRRATSLGGTESLIEHRASIEPDSSPTPDSLLRLSIGLEHVDDLIDDLTYALDG
jgi:cystathionine gamma-synthase